MEKSNEISHGLFKTILTLALLIFIATLVFDSYLVLLNRYLNNKAKSLAQNWKVAKIFLDYGNGQKRAFEGEIVGQGLSLMDALFLVSEAGNIKIGFKETNDMVLVDFIDNYVNAGGHYWEIGFSDLDWKKRLDEFDARQLIFTNGTVASLTYH
ncbi:MAG: hypothetical protein Q8N90_00965 [bacterium]|nr:hypothetical protein [bacterium]